jgi:outer membrane receptor protein involved in Fe transport
VRTFLRGIPGVSAAIAIFLALAFGSLAAVASPKSFNIVSEDARRSLLEFGRQSEEQILFATEEVKGVITNAVHGNYEPIDALHLLLRGTTLVASQKPDGVLVVEPLKGHSTPDANRVPTPDPGSSLGSAQASETRGSSTTDANVMDSKLHVSEAAGLEEIVVTATRRSERLQDVPISVMAFSQEKMDAQGLKNIDDLSRLSPGLNFQRNGMSSSGSDNDESSDINIRGVDSAAGTSTTGIYIDDTPIQTRHIDFASVNAFPALFDVDRVEVLRGPQGTLFGAGAEGGVVRFLSPEPDLHKTSGYARADVATTDGGAPSYEGGAAFGAPLIDDVLAFRVSVSYRKDGGWVDRVGYSLSPSPLAQLPTPIYNGDTAQANANWQETTTARLAVTWKVSESLEITPSIYYQRLYINDTAAYWVALSDASANVYRNGNAVPNSSNDPFTLSALKLKWDLGFASLFSNTSFYDRNQRATSDFTQYLRATWSSIPSDGAPAYQLPNPYPAPGDRGYAPLQDNQRNFYEEIRLASNDTDARILWSTGLFYSRLSENAPEGIVDPTLDSEVIAYTGGADSVCSPRLPCPGGLLVNTPTARAIDKQLAAFGELTFKLTDTLKATAGLRGSKLNYDFAFVGGGPFIGKTINSRTSSSDNPVTPKAVLSWQPDRDNLVYLSASKGFRPGGLNTPVSNHCGPDLNAIGINQAPGNYGADSLWSYEIGSKNTFLDHTLQIDASLFYIDWNQIQQNVYLPSCGQQFTANLGKAKSEGGDIEVLYRPIDALTLDLTAAYTDARFTKSSCAGALTYDTASSSCPVPNEPAARPIATNGDALLGAPWSFTASSEYHFPQWQGRTPYFRADFQHSTAQKSLLPQQDSNNGLFDNTLPGLPVVNNLSLRAGLRFNGMDISAYANNVTNAHPLMFESRDIAPYAGPSGTGASQLGPTTDNLYFARGVRPRTIGVTATYRY